MDLIVNIDAGRFLVDDESNVAASRHTTYNRKSSNVVNIFAGSSSCTALIVLGED